MWQLPCALALGVLLERNEWSLVGIVGVGGVLLLASFLSERRSRDLEAARARREAEERVRLCRDAAIVGGALKLSPREKIHSEFFFGHGQFSAETHRKIGQECDWAATEP